MKRITLTIVAGAAALAAALPGQAAAGLPYSQAQAECVPGARIVVSAPSMAPLSNLAFGAGNALIIGANQQVAYRATVARWSGSTWYVYDRSPWRSAWVGQDGSWSYTSWLNLDTNRYDAGYHDFRISHTGTYKVWVEYYWYADQHFPSASAGGYIDSLSFWDYTRYPMGTAPDAACHF